MKIGITGAFTYSGKYVAEVLVKKNHQIVNLTNHPKRQHNLDVNYVQTFPLKFDNKCALTKSLEGVEVLVQNYWVRFDDYKGISRQQVIDNSITLIDCAKKAGVKKIVYTSHTQTSLNSPYPYIKGKAMVEEHLKQSGLQYGIVRPCAIFGDTPSESILINNICYLVRTFPIFCLPGDGKYHFQPVHVRDLRDLIIYCIDNPDNQDLDAVGPENFQYKELIQYMASTLNTTCIPITHIPKNICYLMTKPLDYILNDRIIDKDDLSLMIDGITQSLKPPTGKLKLSQFISENKYSIGQKWISSIEQHYK